MSSQIQTFTTLPTACIPGEIVAPAVGGQIPVAIDIGKFRDGAGVGLLVNIADNSSADYDIEVTGNHMSTATKVWNKHDVIKAKTKSSNGNLAYPVTAVRLYFRSIQGTVTLSVIQADM